LLNTEINIYCLFQSPFYSCTIKQLFDQSDILIEASWCWGKKDSKKYSVLTFTDELREWWDMKRFRNALHQFLFSATVLSPKLSSYVLSYRVITYCKLGPLILDGTYETEERREYSEVHFIFFIPWMCFPSLYYPINALPDTTNITYKNSYMFRHRGALFRDLLQQRCTNILTVHCTVSMDNKFKMFYKPKHFTTAKLRRKITKIHPLLYDLTK